MDKNSMAASDPIPGSGVIEIECGNAYKQVIVNVQAYGDRPTARTQAYPAPGSNVGSIDGHMVLGEYTVEYDWPEGSEPKVTVTP